MSRKLRTADVNAIYNKAKFTLENKYYNLWKAKWKWTGLNYREQDYITKQFYAKGTVAAFNIPLVGIGLAPWALTEHDMYGLPEKIQLVNEWGSPLVPTNVQIVDRDAVIGYAQSNKKPIYTFVNYYIERIAEVETALWINLQHQKIPFLITNDNDDKKKENRFSAEELVNRIINGELIVGADGVDVNSLSVIQTGAPYLLDKLTEYKQGLENELKTYLGCDNQGEHLTREQMQMDEINANNEEINSCEDDMLNNLKQFCDNVKEFLGIEIDVEPAQERVTSIGEEHDAPERYNTDKGDAE